MEADTTAATSHVEHAATDVAHRLPFVRIVPSRERCEQVGRVERHDEPVVALDDLGRVTASEGILQERSVDVVSARHRRNLTVHESRLRTTLIAPVHDADHIGAESVVGFEHTRGSRLTLAVNIIEMRLVHRSEAVVSDEGFWVGPSDLQRIFVVYVGEAPSADINAGSTVSFTGASSRFRSTSISDSG
jgi:hypothetical protein